MSMRLSASIYAICILLISFSTICALIPFWRFLIEIVFNFLQAFEEKSPFKEYKTALFESKKNNWSGISKFTRTVFIFNYYVISWPNFDVMMLKIERTLILCIVAVLAKTCLDKFTPEIRRTSYNFTSGKNSGSFVISRKLLNVLKNNFCY